MDKGWQENPRTNNYVERHEDLLAALQDVDGVVYVSDREVEELITSGNIAGFIAELYEAWEEASAVGF
jgi:hypothetical protein